MNNLIKVGDTKNSKGLITSLEVVKQVNLFRNEEGDRSKLEHSDLLKVIRDEFEEEIGAGIISPAFYKDVQGKDRPMFELTLSQSKQLLMRESKFVRKAMIAYIDKLEKIISASLPDFSNPAEAARAWAKEYEEKQTLLISNEQMKPKAEFYDAVTGSSDTIDMRIVATTLNMGIGRNKIFEILREKGILDRKNVPYQYAIDAGYFRTVESSYSKPDGTNCINIKTVVFQKGLNYIRKTVEDYIKSNK